jgi:hypothetical protein
MDGGARNAVARRTHRHGGVDGNVDGFGHDGDGLGQGNDMASDSGGRDSEAERRGSARSGSGAERRGGRCVWTAAVRTALSERLLSHPVRSDTAAHSSQSGHGAARHCR